MKKYPLKETSICNFNQHCPVKYLHKHELVEIGRSTQNRAARNSEPAALKDLMDKDIAHVIVDLRDAKEAEKGVHPRSSLNTCKGPLRSAGQVPGRQVSAHFTSIPTVSILMPSRLSGAWVMPTPHC